MMDCEPPSFTGGETIDDFVKSAMMTVKGCQKMAMELQGWQHYRDYPGVQQTIDEVNSTISTVIGTIFCHQDIKLDLSDLRLSDKLEMIREGNDAVLERINSDIDEAAGVKKHQDAELMSPVIKKVQAPSTPSGKNVVLLAARNVQKPQLFFTEKVNNLVKHPFVPFLTEKPNSLKPLSILICLDPSGREYYSHPYEFELNHWDPAPSQLECTKAIPPHPMEDTPLVMIDTEEELSKLVKELSACTEFAVDLEHHAFRSYLGLTCLMQISTRTTDYIVDTLALRGKLTILNEAFTNPKITKVIHGSDYDVLWLQRDCGVYLVNLFDTHQASIVLEYPHRSLAALLLRFCNIQANKIFQRADWRIRPLPEEFIEYGRQDTHCLLYIFDQLRNELIEKGNHLKNLITSVYDRSRDLCLKRYEKPIVGRESHMVLYRHSRKAFNSKQMFALRELYLWRDKIGREQDESPEYVLPKHMLLQIAEVLPKEMQGILACCNPIPPLVKTELLTLHTIIREAREQPTIEIKHTDVPIVQQYPSPMEALNVDLNHSLTCKHDLSHCEDDAKELPTLMNSQTTFLKEDDEVCRIHMKLKHSSELFGPSKHAPKPSLPLDIKSVFISPFERYTAYQEFKPFLEEEKDKKKKGVEVQDLERVNRVKEHFLTLTKNTPEVFKDSRTFSGENRAMAESSNSVTGKDGEQFSNPDTVDAERNPVKRKKGNARPKKKYVWGEVIKEEKAEKSGKRKATGTDNENESSPKVQKVATATTVGEVTTVAEDDKKMQEPPQQGFNYDAQDYTIFHKAQKKAERQKVKEGFKGKNQKMRKGKSSMKTFTWGNNPAPRRQR